jgi:diaminopimelate decarboxylase
MTRICDEGPPGAWRCANGELWCENLSTVGIAARFGTPLYVVSASRLRSNCGRLKEAFERHWQAGDVQLFPSLKANFVLAVRRILNEEGLGCDVFGSHELRTALKAGVPGARISVNGSSKNMDVITAAIEAGAYLTLDSEQEVEFAMAAAERLGRRARVRLRLRPDHDRLTQASDFFPDMTIRDAAQIYKPGIEPKAAIAIGRRALAHPAIELTGLMTHLGRHSADPAVWSEMAHGFGEVVAQLCRAWSPWRPQELDVGGGLPAASDPTSPARTPARDLHEYAAAICTSLDAALTEGGVAPRGITLQIEPGRSLFADAGLHLTRVQHVKRQSRPVARVWVETDTSEVFLPDLVWERAHFRPVFASRAAAAPIQEVELVGISCNFDILARQVAAPAVEAGDVIAFLDTGAYQDAGASNFNALGRPGTVLIEGSHARLVKRAETLEDVLARDSMEGEHE